MLRSCLVCMVIALVLAGGCTSITGTPGKVSVISTPAGADVFFDGIYKGTAPRTIENVVPGHHHILLRGPGDTVYQTDISVDSGKTEIVTWQPGLQVTPSPETATFPAFTISNIRGYRGGGEYLTSLTFDLALTSGAKPVNISATRITLNTGSGTKNPYWVVLDRKLASTDDILETDEIFAISLQTPQLDPGSEFTLIFTPEAGEPLVVTRQVPAIINIDVGF
jgi:hypothetical protein